MRSTNSEKIEVTNDSDLVTTEWSPSEKPPRPPQTYIYRQLWQARRTSSSVKHTATILIILPWGKSAGCNKSKRAISRTSDVRNQNLRGGNLTAVFSLLLRLTLVEVCFSRNALWTRRTSGYTRSLNGSLPALSRSTRRVHPENTQSLSRSQPPLL